MQTDKRAIRLAVNNTLEKYSVLCTPEVGEAIANAVIEALLEKTQRRQSKRQDYFELARTIASVCGIQLKPNSGMIFREAKLLSSAEPMPTPELVQRHYGKNSDSPRNWYKCDWRGKRGQNPAPVNIRMTWFDIVVGAQPSDKPLVVK